MGPEMLPLADKVPEECAGRAGHRPVNTRLRERGTIVLTSKDLSFRRLKNPQVVLYLSKPSILCAWTVQMKCFFGFLIVLTAFGTIASVHGLASNALAAERLAGVKIERQIKNRNFIGTNVVRVTEGQIVELILSSDEAVELHLHGYDVVAKAKPGAPAVMGFSAHATGRYPVTMHGHSHGGTHSEKTLLYLEVHPD